jgi:hypothetical protein
VRGINTIELRPILIAYGVRINPWTAPNASAKSPTMTPLGFIRAASLPLGSGPGRVERRENAIAKQKRVCDICSVDVFPYDVALGVTPSREREN